MNELSRMERHQSRHKGRKKNKAAAYEDTVGRLQEDKEYDTSSLSRSRHKPGMEHAPYASEGSEEIEGLSRTSTYPSHRVRMSKWFVNTLIVLFILLMAGLLIWGLIGAPPLEEIL